MLDYEKKLHLDERWERLRSCATGKNVVQMLFSVLCYTALYLSMKCVLGFLPDRTPWQASPPLTAFWGLSFARADAVFFGLGLLAYLYGSIRYRGINRQNHSVRRNGDTPDALLTEDYYAKVRHPMYGVFVICFAAVLLSLRSLIGMVLTVAWTALQYANARREEKRVLRPLFADRYDEYCKRVRRMLLTPAETTLLVLAMAAGLVGLFIQ